MLALVCAGWACYSPKIDEGAFVCGDNQACPHGFSCFEGRCYTRDPAGGGAGGSDGGGNMCEQRMGVCSPATQSVGTCDPVCQRDCSCDQRCTIGDGEASCFPIEPGARALGTSCDPVADDCDVGLVCLAEVEPACGAHCYRFCRSDQDCIGRSRCFPQAVFEGAPAVMSIGVCSPRVEACNPVGDRPTCVGDRDPQLFGCYILSPMHADEPVCDCAGSLPEDAPCTDLHECLPGLECINDGSERRCRRLCNLDSPALTVRCGLGKSCRKFPNSSKIGFCEPL